MGSRALISLANGRVDAEFWHMAAAEEPPVKGEPMGCPGCPLRPGGEWEDGVRAVAAELRPERMAGWGCHASSQPCAGMRRMLAEVARG